MYVVGNFKEFLYFSINWPLYYPGIWLSTPLIPATSLQNREWPGPAAASLRLHLVQFIFFHLHSRQQLFREIQEFLAKKEEEPHTIYIYIYNNDSPVHFKHKISKTKLVPSDLNKNVIQKDPLNRFFLQ